MKQIAQALCKAQKQFAPALKTATNPHFKSKYVGLDGCVEAVIDALNNNGIYLMQRSHDCENGVKIETILLHESGEEFSGGVLHVPATKNDAQGYGSALTYARRYSLMATCGIAPEDDDGNAASKKTDLPLHGKLKESPAPNLQPPPLSEIEYIECLTTIVSCTDVETLKGVFAGAWKRANENQKAGIQEKYNLQKSTLEKVA
jgi:hypothetical protein